MEQRINSKCLYKFGKSAGESYAMLKQVYGNDTVTLKTVYAWFKQFSDGRENVEDDHRSGQPTTAAYRYESRPFTSQIKWIFWNARRKKPQKSMKISQIACGVGIPSGLKSERKIRGTPKETSEKNNALRRLKPRFEGSVN
ncbi:hypothetical protein AVEN_198690-1 [Araneus ventricosus]|uniref:Mos1 transposase HTH domain-containing protein n=1 Tax=Araneus ventricosus TaxID=182803 RepID=A0A4Y2HEI4_ARAVE|nr:hypothetical protein AVEN_198690-1 [Araneus ventricosus]